MHHYLASEAIASYLQTLNSRKVRTYSLTSGAPWIIAQINRRNALENVHDVANQNPTLLKKGRAFWLSKITGIDPTNRSDVNQALTPHLNTLTTIIENGITQETNASIKISLSALKASLRDTPAPVKEALQTQIQQEEIAIEDPLDVKKQQLQQQITLLENYISPNDSTSTTATEQPSSEAISEAYRRLVLPKKSKKVSCALPPCNIATLT